MNKAELLAYIATLVAQLTELNIEFTAAQTTGTNAELEKEIERLESLLPDEIEDEPAPTEHQDEAAQANEQALENSKSEDKTLKEDAAKTEQATRRVFISKGVNIETIKSGLKVVLQGGNFHTVDTKLARSIVAENHGRYSTDEDEADDSEV